MMMIPDGTIDTSLDRTEKDREAVEDDNDDNDERGTCKSSDTAAGAAGAVAAAGMADCQETKNNAERGRGKEEASREGGTCETPNPKLYKPPIEGQTNPQFNSLGRLWIRARSSPPLPPQRPPPFPPTSSTGALRPSLTHTSLPPSLLA